MSRSYPVGKAQQMVLDALGLTAKDFADAEAQFEALGIVVSPRREGRTSVPAVTVRPRFGGAFTAGGDGVEYREYDEHDFSAIEQWIED